MVSGEQSELPWPILPSAVESDHRCTSGIYFDNTGDNMTLTVYNLRLPVLANKMELFGNFPYDLHQCYFGNL